MRLESFEVCCCCERILFLLRARELASQNARLFRFRLGMVEIYYEVWTFCFSLVLIISIMVFY
jgi:hypothetical protein